MIQAIFMEEKAMNDPIALAALFRPKRIRLVHLPGDDGRALSVFFHDIFHSLESCMSSMKEIRKMILSIFVYIQEYYSDYKTCFCVY